MKSITIQDIKTQGSKVLINEKDEGPTLIIVNSRPFGVFLDMNKYEEMIQMLEDYEDIQSVKELENEATVPWKEVKLELAKIDEENGDE